MQEREGARREGAVRLDVVVKLGGSIVTAKNGAFEPNMAVLEEAAAVLASEARSGTRLGLVIGGGSYGHVAASEQERWGGPAPAALYSVTSAMQELATLVADVLASHGLYTVTYPPHALCRPQGLRPRCSWETVEAAVAAGAAPLMYGDAYPCRSRGWCIVSGDELAMEMACSLGAGRVVYATSVDGVLGEGGLVERLTLDQIGRVLEGVGRGQGPDVTGGMARKLRAIEANWCPGIREVWIVNGLEPARLRGALRGAAYGTLIAP